MEAKSLLGVRFSCGEDTEIGVSLLGFEVLRTSPEEPRRWFACRCESGLRFVLEVEGETFDDFALVSMLEN